MTKINLREQYPDFYKTDYIIEVPDSGAECVMFNIESMIDLEDGKQVFVSDCKD